MWENRIIQEGEESPDQLLANPQNWRIHPKHQQDALETVMDRVGWVQRVIVNKTTGHVVDGHLRVAMAISRNEKTVPVVYVEISPDEEALVLATLDPLSAMAGTDGEKLTELLRDLPNMGADVDGLLSELHSGLIIPEDNRPIDETAMADTENECPKCGFQW